MERERVKEPDADQLSDYDKTIRHYQEWAERQKSGKLLIRGDERQFQVSRQGIIKYYLNALFTDTAVSSWGVFEHLIKRQSGRHRHQGGIIIYVLEGHGMTETVGEVLEWQAGDLLLLPVQPGGCSHQHWNKDASKGCRWVAFRDLLVARFIANAIDQLSEMPDMRGGAATSPEGRRRRDWKATASVEQLPLVANPDDLANVNLFDRLLALRDLQRQRLQQATWLIRGDELPWELNAHGKMQWYLHPYLAYTAVQTQLFYRQEIPEGSRSGVQRHGGDAVFYILEGEGYTEVDGVRHVWKGGDVMTLPVFPDGVIYRHVNTGTAPVRLICIERNLVHTVGVDRQSGFEQLQPCPEYRQSQSA
jgi:gentisate 1,2-dioxygenase